MTGILARLSFRRATVSCLLLLAVVGKAAPARGANAPGVSGDGRGAPTLAVDWAAEGDRLYRAGDLEAAATAWERACEADPRASAPRLALGLVWLKLGRGAASVASFLAAQRLAPADPLVAYHLGLAYQLAGDLPAARAAYERALAVEPGHAAARANLAALVGAPAYPATPAPVAGVATPAPAPGVATLAPALGVTTLPPARFVATPAPAPSVASPAPVGMAPASVGAASVAGASPAVLAPPATPGAGRAAADATWAPSSMVLRRAEARLARNDLDGAYALLRDGVAARPADAALWRALGRVLARRRDLEGAEALLRKAIALAPADPAGPLALAPVLAAAGRAPEAAAQIAAAVRAGATPQAVARARAAIARGSVD